MAVLIIHFSRHDGSRNSYIRVRQIAMGQRPVGRHSQDDINISKTKTPDKRPTEKTFCLDAIPFRRITNYGQRRVVGFEWRCGSVGGVVEVVGGVGGWRKVGGRGYMTFSLLPPNPHSLPPSPSIHLARMLVS